MNWKRSGDSSRVTPKDPKSLPAFSMKPQSFTAALFFLAKVFTGFFRWC